ncbi:MAG: hypothetical protein EOO28_27150 [Comamonadaceae bacterium]|nr:MAG: hypothetical protein EOO28_27150 [Comamonadaceae bacterium]
MPAVVPSGFRPCQPELMPLKSSFSVAVAACFAASITLIQASAFAASNADTSNPQQVGQSPQAVRVAVAGGDGHLKASMLETASGDARFAMQWVAGNRDNEGMPFVIVDKKSAQMYVFEADGRLVNSTPVLLGAGFGDASVPGIEKRDVSSLRTEEKTTPAGRFVSEPGRNLTGEDIVWVDYGAKIAIHRLRPDASLRLRSQRMASSEPDAKRVSAGCIVVPVAFYEEVVKPMLGKRRGMVYVLPESRPVQNMFGAYDLSLSQP